MLVPSRTEHFMEWSSGVPREMNGHQVMEGVPTVNRNLQNTNALPSSQCGLSASCCGDFGAKSSWVGNKPHTCPPRGGLSASVNVPSRENDSLQQKGSLMESFEEVVSKEDGLATQFEIDTPDSDEKTLMESKEGEVIFASEHVCVYPSKNCRIIGRLSLVKHPGTLYLAWMPYGRGAMNEDGTFQLQQKIEFTGEETDRTMYAVHPIPLSDIKAISRHVSRLSWHYIIIVLNSGLTLPPFYFNKGGVRSFISALKEHAESFVIKSSSDPNEFLINSTLDPIQRSLTALDLEDILIGSVPEDSLKGAHCPTQDHSQLIGPESLLSSGISIVTKLAKETTSSFFGVMEENGILGASNNLGSSISEPLSKASSGERDTQAPVGPDSSIPVPTRSRSLRRSDSGSMADTEVGSFEFVDLKLGEPSRREKRPWGLPITRERWRAFFDSEGKGCLIHMDQFREEVFYGGVDHELKKECWKFLLGFYPPDSTQQERLILTLDKTHEYKKLLSQWQTISEEQEKKFCKWRERKKRIEKDVRRTDRSHPFFMDEEGEPLKAMRRILLTYAMYNFDLGYCQGMSDLLAPLVYVLMKDVSPNQGGRWLEAESEAFWCFVALMDKRECNFHTDQRGMHSQLLSLEKLLRLLDPQLWTCFKKLESLNFFCCFRWVLILFKREFSFEEVLRLWEALWANYRTEHFHLYMCIATLMDCRKEILENVTDFDMLIKYCVDLSHRIPLLHIMRQAEVLAIHAKPFEKEIMGGLDPTDGHT